MKTKLISLILAALMLASLASCGSKQPERGNISDESTSQNDTESTKDSADNDVHASAPVREGNTYTSSFLGAKITLDENWTFSTDEEIAQQNSAVVAVAGDDYEKQLENADILYDMAATCENGDNISINFENLGALYGKVITPETYFSLSESSIKQMLANMGCENIETSVDKVTFAGSEELAMFVKAELYEIPVYEICVAKKCGNYMACITIATLLEDTTADILAKFVPVD